VMRGKGNWERAHFNCYLRGGERGDLQGHFGYELGEIFDDIFEKGEIYDHKGDPRREKISLAEAYVRGLVEWNPVRMFIEACEKGIVTPPG